MADARKQEIAVVRFIPSRHRPKTAISPYLWPNGKIPVREEWKMLAQGGFREYRLKVGGLVENPVELSLDELAALGRVEHITMHHCIQGWSGIAKGGGIPMKTLIGLVCPKAEARVVAFFSFGEALYGGPYYDTQSLQNVLKAVPARFPDERTTAAAGLRSSPPAAGGEPVRVQDREWIERIEFTRSEKELGKGEGGKNEYDEYFDLLANI